MEQSDTAPYRTILVAFDGTDGAEAALRKATGLARAWSCSLTLARCLGELETSPRPKDAAPADPARAEEALDSLREAVARLEDLPEPRLQILEGDPPDALVAFAREIGADLIVAGSRGQALMHEAVMGRVTSALVSNAPCDVLVVQPEGKHPG